MIKRELLFDSRPEHTLSALPWHLIRPRNSPPGAGGGQVEVGLARVWAELTQGRHRIVETYVTEQRCCVVLGPASGAGRSRAALAAGRIETLESILLGEERKVVALRQGVNVRTVTANATYALRALGCRCLLSRLPMALFTLVYAAQHLTDLSKGRLGPLDRGGVRHRLLTFERVDDCVVNMLSPAEAAVTRLSLAGVSHDEIAKLRSTARHTIANQLTATFQKLGVSGRIDLLRMLHVDSRAHELRALHVSRCLRSVPSSILVAHSSGADALAPTGTEIS